MEPLNAYQQGKRAGSRRDKRDTCPHPEGTSEAQAWLVGWKEATSFLDRCSKYCGPKTPARPSAT